MDNIDNIPDIDSLSESDRELFDKAFALERVSLGTAYTRLFVGGCVGLHQRYLSDYNAADTSRSIAWLYVIGMLAFLVSSYLPMRTTEPIVALLRMIGIAASYLGPIAILIRFSGDVFTLPDKVHLRNIAIQEKLLQKHLPSVTEEKTAAPTKTELSTANAHALYHEKFHRLKVSTAYLWLFSMGAFGVHRDYLGDRKSVDDYLLLVALPVWLGVIGTPLWSVISSIDSSIFAFLVIFSVIVGAILLGLLVVRLAADVYGLAGEVAAKNVESSTRVLRELEMLDDTVDEPQKLEETVDKQELVVAEIKVSEQEQV